MLKNILVTVFFFVFFQAQSQNTDESIVVDNSISTQLYTKCFDNLNQGNELFEKYPTFQKTTFCSLLSCSYLLAYKETDIQRFAEEMLIGITTQLFKEGNPVYLISGLESSTEAIRRNENLNDDNNIVYISYGECTNPIYLSNAAKIVNKQTLFLINQSVIK
ncbi:hypothetical protein HNP37_004131 [Flavobacterium nitrogenifigens]|uniref:Uncharacterized protein n=2 Tax=Flavobacterium TaxID=237 RepID=A0A7W7J0L2_9FLAO|nr:MULTISPECIES: hypothetical protein [Flavobacterium]MBB4804051.1 hypothetical protein [Flavobacterium nitrogenifigens]MBB6388797.1 hypothetical protein [Flavobacterium notoginsengisoli]